jgi:deoxyribodipyrimidine photolyase-related protein
VVIIEKISLIFPNQLFMEHPSIEKDREIYLVEEGRYFTDFNFHKKKLVLHRASMKAYADLLEEKGLKVHYNDYKNDWRSFLKGKRISMVRPYDSKLESELPDQIQFHESPSFIGGELKKGKRYLMASFYRKQREDTGILMDAIGPMGGKLSFDAENRKKLPRNHEPPDVMRFGNTYIDEAIDYVNENFPDNPGKAEDFFYPVTHGEARKLLDQFVSERLELFGDYQDAISKEHDFIYHSLLSSSLNIGLLTPDEILKEVEDSDAPLNSKEGFIRQVLGWREFILKIYLKEGKFQRTNNHFGHFRKLPDSFYNASIGVDPIDDVVEKVSRNAYAHHIERLMVLGNYMLLNEYDPDDIYRWFMEMFIDAYDWVMVPNVYGMSQYADGGLMSTKPYFSSSNYILKMSDFGKGDWCQKWDDLFWDFIEKHQEEFSKNPRMSLMVKQLERRKKKTR